MKKNKTAVKKKKENQIVTLRDIKACKVLLDDHYEDFFYCPKCGNSMISVSEEYPNNNITNSMEDAGDNFRTLVMHCENCGCNDLLMKFVKKRERTWLRDLPRSKYPQPIRWPKSPPYKTMADDGYDI